MKTAKSYAEDNNFTYKKGIVMPPENFPTGCSPIFVEISKDAMKEARKRTKDGILVISHARDIENIEKDLNLTKEKWKMYYCHQNDFKENENPYKFLQEGNVLVVDIDLTSGFEWTTVIVIEKVISYAGADLHECNQMMRCTANLIVVRKRKSN